MRGIDPSASARTDPCRCAHPQRAHEHYRRGTDCALCGCRRFRPAHPWLHGLTTVTRRLTHASRTS